VRGEATGHDFRLDSFSRVFAEDSGGGHLTTQSVEALLLLEILAVLKSAKPA
jgi:hypothetical protein